MGPHLVHRIAEADLRVGVRKPQGTTRTRMAERVWIWAVRIMRLRKHEARAEARRHAQNFIGTVGFLGMASRNLAPPEHTPSYGRWRRESPRHAMRAN